jgi:hypothetical protein
LVPTETGCSMTRGVKISGAQAQDREAISRATP